MRYRVHLAGWDMMDQVVVHAAVYDDAGPVISEVLEVGTTVQGEGVSDPAEWLRDALVALLEAM